VEHSCQPAHRTVAIRSLGCRTNQEEIALLSSRLSADGCRVVDDVRQADIIIVNSCSVTTVSEAKTRRLLNALARQAPEARLLVTGCLAQQKPEELLRIRNVHWVVGNRHKDDIPRILGEERGAMVHSPFAVGDDMVASPGGADPGAIDRARFPVKVQEGCDFSCAYCIVPSLRGPSRSAPVDEVVDACRQAESAGFREVVLIGTHIGQYRSGQVTDLLQLAQSIIHETSGLRIRLSSLDPRDLSESLLDFVGSQERMCSHLHVSVQSLCPDVLAAMNRPYEDVERLIDLLAAFRTQWSHAALGGDFIVGYPGETEAMFGRTVEGIGRAGFSYGHVFRFSPRPGTAAPSLPDQVSDQVKQQRSAQARECLAQRRIAFAEAQIGSVRTMVVEREQPLQGLTGNYLRVSVPGRSARHRALVPVRIEGYDVQEQRCSGRIEER
jgi:threonylcarbamoyladenosine tRNA methylthiotransferase MtaB